MTLEQLRLFVGVAEREHVTRAAQALNISQSAVSAAIAAIEGRYGVKLFHRVGRRIELTDAGRAFLVEARAVLGRAAAAEQLLADFGGLERGSLSLVASQTIAGYWLPPRLARFRRVYPAIRIELAIGNTEQAAEQVMDGRAELGFIEGLIDAPALARWPVAGDRMALVGTNAPDRAVDAGWFVSVPWVLREPGSGTRSTFEAVLAGMGLSVADLDVALVLPSNEAVRTAVAAGVGYSMLSALVVTELVEREALSVVPFALEERPFFGLRHKERYRTRAADALLDLIGGA